MADSENGITYEEVPSSLLHFIPRIEVCNEVVGIFKGWNLETAAQKKLCLHNLARLKENIFEIKSLLKESEKLQGLLKEEKARAASLKFRSDFLINNIPDRFNCPNQLSRPGEKVHGNANVQSASNKPHAKNEGTCKIPTVSYLSVEEFEKVPKYMKGRVTYNKINMFIDVLNKVLSHKYAIYMKKRSTLKKTDVDLWNVFHKQELRETKGMFFCVGDDFRTFHGCALDKTNLSMLTILRHCQRLREIRTGGILRYVLLF